MFWNINIVLALTLIYLYLAIGLIIGLAIPLIELFTKNKLASTPLRTSILKWSFLWLPIIVIKFLKFIIKITIRFIIWGIVTLVNLYEMAKSNLARKT